MTADEVGDRGEEVQEQVEKVLRQMVEPVELYVGPEGLQPVGLIDLTFVVNVEEAKQILAELRVLQETVGYGHFSNFTKRTCQGGRKWEAKGGQSPPPLILGTIKTNAFSANAQSRFVSVVLDGVLQPSRLGRHTLILCSSRSYARGRSKALERCNASNSLLRVRYVDEGVAGRHRREKCFPAGDRPINDFYTSTPAHI